MTDQNQSAHAGHEVPGLAALRNPFTTINNTTTSSSSAAEASQVSPTSSSASPTDRRQSAEWDASKVPPSRFQRRKGSIYSTPASRDGHVDRNYAERYHDKLVEKGWAKK